MNAADLWLMSPRDHDGCLTRHNQVARICSLCRRSEIADRRLARRVLGYITGQWSNLASHSPDLLDGGFRSILMSCSLTRDRDRAMTPAIDTHIHPTDSDILLLPRCLQQCDRRQPSIVRTTSTLRTLKAHPSTLHPSIPQHQNELCHEHHALSQSATVPPTSASRWSLRVRDMLISPTLGFPSKLCSLQI
jgi:hypothetical protein